MYYYFCIVIGDLAIGSALLFVLFCLYHLYYHEDGSPGTFCPRNSANENPLDNGTITAFSSESVIEMEEVYL